MTTTLEPDTAWQIVEPGLIMLPGTGICIRYLRNRGWYQVEHNGHAVSAKWSMLLVTAKKYAMDHCREMIAIGIDP